MIASARLTNCEESVVKLSNDYNSMIGEDDCELSEGERQHILILKNAPILLLDEATVKLDKKMKLLFRRLCQGL